MATTAAITTRVEDKLKDQLNLKFSAASRLIQEAREKAGPESSADDDALLKLATSIYKKYPKKEQKEMKLPPGGANTEPEWKQKFVAAAERREREWQAANENGGEVPEGPTLPPNVLSQTVTKRVGSEDPNVETVTQEIPRKEATEENTSKTVCYCTIL